MEHFGGGGNWTMIPNIQSHSNPATSSSQDHLFLQQQQQFQPQFNQPPQQSQSRFQEPPQQQKQQQEEEEQSLASHFHLLHLVENLADVTENGTRDQQTDALVAELNTQFEKCQQLLNTIGTTIKDKSATVAEQKRRLEETEKLLAQRRDVISNIRKSVEELINSQM